MDKETSICECGRKLDYVISPFMTSEVRICKCGRKHYVDSSPINWQQANRCDCEYCRYYESRHDMGFHGTCEVCLIHEVNGEGKATLFEVQRLTDHWDKEAGNV